MATFHIAQRVRVVMSDNYPETVGREAVITAYDPSDPDNPYCVHVQGVNFQIWGNSSNLEPIVDDGRTVVDWATMPFDPREVTA